ncbi:MAG TPA: hypothetical protein VGL32_13765 [Acidimicrobiales bacterium]
MSVVIAMTTGDESKGVDRLLGDLGRWAADARASDAASARSRERWLRRQAAEEATLPGVALDLAERGEPVVLKTTSGRAHRGRLVAVARDVWVLRSDASDGVPRQDGIAGATFVATDAIASLRAQPGGSAKPTPEAAGARPVPLAASMADMLAELAVEHPRVRVLVLGEPEAMVGQLRSVGVDVATLWVAGEPPTTVYVRLGSVSELSVLGSG